MPRSPTQSPIPLFDRSTHHSSVPTGIASAAARSGGPGRPHGRRERASSWTGASTVAGWRRIGLAMCRMSFVSLLLTMTSLTALAQSPPPLAPTQSHGSDGPFADFIGEASRRFGLPTTWIRAVMQAESGGDARAVSSKGAMGLMQIMPGTWAALRARYHLGADPFDAHDNILAGVAFLRELYDRYGAPGFLAAYQAGPRRYEDHLTTGRALPADTRAYVAALAPMVSGTSDDSQMAVTDPLSWARAPLFVVQHNGAAAAASDAIPSQPRRTEADRAAVEVLSLAPQSDGLFVPVAGHRP